MKQFIKSSVRVKADPFYYIRKADKWIDQRNALFEEVERLETAAGGETRESLEVHRRAMALDAKVKWALSRVVPASNLFEQERLKVTCPTCGEGPGRYCWHDASHHPHLCFARGRATLRARP